MAPLGLKAPFSDSRSGVLGHWVAQRRHRLEKGVQDQVQGAMAVMQACGLV